MTAPAATSNQPDGRDTVGQVAWPAENKVNDGADDCRRRSSRPGIDWEFRAAVPADAGWIAELRAVVMRADLERLDRFDPVRVRKRFLSAFEPEHTRVIVVDGDEIGAVAVRPAGDSIWIEHFYLEPAFQGNGIGSGVLRAVLAADYRGVAGTGVSASVDSAADVESAKVRFRLNVLQGSAARRLYERHGFVLDSEDPIDVYLVGPRVPVRG
jgi:GNAT superfamily N-acetyltransferase